MRKAQEVIKVSKAEVVSLLNEIGILLELIGENPFKVRAYANGARVLEGQSEEIEELVRSGKLGELPGFGPALTEKVTTLVTTGRLPYYEDLKKKVPAGLLEMIRIPGLGPKKAKALFDHLKIDSIEKLEKACRKHEVSTLEGFGEKSEQKILEGIQHHQKYAERHLYPEALAAAQLLRRKIKMRPEVIDCEIAGSLRRHRETIGDVDLLASSKKPQSVMEFFTTLPEVATIIGHGETKSSITLKESGIQVDLRVVSEEEFPNALHHFTGSAEHNIQMRHRAQTMGMKLNEYGLFKTKGKKEVGVPCRTEEEIFKALKLSFIPPEMREGSGEIAAAEKNKIPKLVEEKDIRGIFHVHSTWSDGTAPLEAMIAEAERLGLEYVGISDHSQSAYYAKGLKPDRLKQQEKEIEGLRKKFKIRIFWGIESDILPDGSLDYPAPILERFDFVIGSVHSSFTMPEKEMTARVAKAVKNKYFTILGHSTGRLLLGREPFAIDMKKIIDVAGDEGKWIELNAHPSRCDLDWRLLSYAKEKGVKIPIDPDAHSIEDVANYQYGVGLARKGWLAKDDVITTLPAVKMEKLLTRTKPGS